jgi:hypothetical protein
VHTGRVDLVISSLVRADLGLPDLGRASPK